MPKSLYSALFIANPEASFAMRLSLSSTLRCLFLALAGIITFLPIFLTYGLSGISCLSSSVTTPCECASLVVVLKIIGVSYSSLSSNASFVNSFASELSEGSSTGIIAALATIRVSCSFCELYIPGSSATLITRPPFTPMYAHVYNGSEATLRPTCFMHAIALAPAIEAPIATSVATFSFGDHSAYTSS